MTDTRQSKSEFALLASELSDQEVRLADEISGHRRIIRSSSDPHLQEVARKNLSIANAKLKDARNKSAQLFRDMNAAQAALDARESA